MRFLDKLLLTLAGSSIVAIVMIFLSGEISSHSSSQKLSREQEVPAKEENSALVEVDEDIDLVLNKYFEAIRQNPEEEEEISRIVELSDDDEIILNEDIHKINKALDEKIDKLVEYRKHKVVAGESIWRIAQKYGVPVYTIVSANPQNKHKIIQVGDVLKIPSKKGIVYKIKPSDTVAKIARQYKIDAKQIQIANAMSANQTLRVGDLVFLPEARPLPEVKYVTRPMFIWPVAGRLTSGFGVRVHPILKSKLFHSGIDIGAVTGTPIRASASGVVVFSSYSDGSGNLVIIRHKDNYYSMYAHCSSLIAKKGSFVKQGEVIAKVGNTGMSTGSHLHFEIKRYEKRIDPLVALKKTVKVKVNDPTS